jgi:lycopene cyclase domain-containing protein
MDGPDSLRYLLVLLGCLTLTLPLELWLGVRVYRRPWLVARTLLPVMAVFLAWDLSAHARGHWWFDERYVLGPRLLGLPLEEWLFFAVVPMCGLLTYEAVSTVLDRRSAATAGTPEGSHGR